MLDFTILKVEQIYGDNKLEVFKKRKELAPMTDFSILLGGEVSDEYYYNYSSDNNRSSLENRTGIYWTSTNYSDMGVRAVNYNGVNSWALLNARECGARPALSYSSIKEQCTSNKIADDGVLEVEFGEYPQKVASKELQKELTELHNKIKLKKTFKFYNIDSVDCTNSVNNFELLSVPECKYKGKKYVRVNANIRKSRKEITLSTGDTYQKNDYVWVEVLPVKWLVDEKEDIAVSESILFAGIQFKNLEYYHGDFENTDMKKYFDDCFSNDIIASPKLNKTSDILTDQNSELKNAYEFIFKDVTEEEIIKASLESNITPFLHGKSSEGKSARIKEFDPDAEIVYLRNATPDSLNGKSVYNAEKNEMIDVPPTWYVKLKEKCEAESDKLHIVFFDELTNALPSIQGMAFNIILDKEINGKWKLPENARVAAAGNDLEDSLAANTMVEPLFNRFNHVYINTTVEDWLSWALTPNNTYERLDYKKEDTTKQLKIHPAIYAYIACKKDGVLRTKFTGIKPNADPRKWEMASKVLYQTNNPYMLRGLIGEDLTEDFASFCQKKVISINDVISGNYDDKIFKIDSSEKYLTVLSLSNVDEENLEIVRNFVEKLGKEYLALFDSLWTIGDDERLERLMSLKQIKTKVISL